MRIGLDRYTIGHRDLDAEATLEFAAARGLEGVQFLDPEAIAPGLDAGRLDEVQRRADRLGLYLEVGMPSPNPVRRSRELGRPVAAAEHADALRAHLHAIAALGCRATRAYVGDRHDRFRTDPPWAVQVDATVEVLRLLASELRSLGLRVALETHADLRADELLATIDRVGDDVLGVTLDTGNLAMRLDDPLRATERLAHLVLVTHVKDAVLGLTDRGLCWQARPVGSGIVPIGEMLAILHAANPGLNLSIELHPRTYDLPIREPGWLAFFPGLDPADLESVVELARACERGFESGAMARPAEVEAIPWADRDLEWIDRSAAWLRDWRAGSMVGNLV